jgi:hypothetical protein
MANLEDKGKKESVTGSGFEKKGGFPSQSEPPAKIPTVDGGPGPGAGGQQSKKTDD